MFNRALRDATFLLAGIILAIGITSKAQVYVGGSVGSAAQSGIGDHNPDYSACLSATTDQRSWSPTLFLGYRLGYVGVEAGAGRLFHSHFAGECQGNTGSQDITASQRYLRINGYVPLWFGFEAVPFIGRALIKHTNYEVADSRATTGEYDTHLATGLNNSTFYGLGIQKTLVEKVFVRAEVQKMLNVAEDPWSQRGWHNNVQTFSVGIGRYF